MLKTLTLCALAVAAAASPVSRDLSETIQTRQERAWESKENFCRGWDFRSEEGVEHLWTETGAFAKLDSWVEIINHDGPDRWLKELEHEVFDGVSGRTEADGCGVLGGSCNPGGHANWDCERYWDEAENNTLKMNAYWHFKAAQGVHAKLTELSRKMTVDTLISGLQVDKILEDFGGKKDAGDNVFKTLGIAAGLSGTVGGLAGGGFSMFTSTASGFLSQIFGQLVTVDDSDPAGEIKGNLAEAFKRANDAVETTLRVAVGGGDSQEEYDALPVFKDDMLKTSIGKFFNGGWWLLENDEKLVRDALDAISANLQRKVTNDALSSAGYYLVAETVLVDSEEECGNKKGRHWLTIKGDEWACVMLFRNSGSGVQEKWEEAGDEVYDRLDEYGFGNRVPFYESVIDCARTGDGQVDAEEPVQFDKIPRCFFNLPAKVKERGGGCPANPNFGCDSIKYTDLSDY